MNQSVTLQHTQPTYPWSDIKAKEPLNLCESISLALHDAMETDENVVLLGEDIGLNGGVFRATDGLFQRFGAERVIDTPLAEAMIAGMSIGMAAQGLKPVAEFQFMGFIYSAMDHIISHAARLRNRTRGRLSCPLVYRAPYGGGIHAPEHHSESTEALFAHIPGLSVVIPSSPAQAYGLLLASIQHPDPVIFLEPKRLYRLTKQPILSRQQTLSLGRCFTLQTGDDITLVSWGAMVYETLQAAHQLRENNIQAEVIDVATLHPLDISTIISSVEKTGRCVIVHEAARTCGVGAEIAAQISEKALLSLQAPVARVTGYDTIMPYYQLEKHYLPDVKRILQTIDQTLAFS